MTRGDTVISGVNNDGFVGVDDGVVQMRRCSGVCRTDDIALSPLKRDRDGTAGSYASLQCYRCCDLHNCVVFSSDNLDAAGGGRIITVKGYLHWH